MRRPDRAQDPRGQLYHLPRAATFLSATSGADYAECTVPLIELWPVTFKISYYRGSGETARRGRAPSALRFTQGPAASPMSRIEGRLNQLNQKHI
jgi:hypothetical protein